MTILRNRVLVTVINEDVITPGGIVSAEAAPAFLKAKVLKVGTKSMYHKWFNGWWLKEGDIVKIDNPAYATMPMTEIEFRGASCLIIDENDVNCIL